MTSFRVLAVLAALPSAGAASAGALHASCASACATFHASECICVTLDVHVRRWRMTSTCSCDASSRNNATSSFARTAAR